MMRNLAALAALVLAGFSLPESTLAAPGARGAMPAFRAPLMMRHSPRAIFGHQHRFVRPHAFGHRPPSTRPYGTVNPATPFGTIKPVTPYGTVAASTAFGTVAPVTRPRLVRRHHRAYHQGWSFPLTVEGGVGYIGTPYDPAELIPVYAPAPAVEEVDETEPAPARPRASMSRDENADACRSERVTVPSADGERAITVVRC